MTSIKTTPIASSIRLNIVAGCAVILILAGGLGGWAATTDVSSAVIAPGTLVVDSNDKKVQHPTGGIVAELRTKDGDRVEAGAVLIKLDDTVTKSNLAVVTKRLDELMARKGRLQAEIGGTDHIEFPDALWARRDDPAVAELIASNRSLFEVRRVSRDTQKFQLREQIKQLENEVQGNEGQKQTKEREVSLVQSELDGARQLWQRNLMPVTKYTALRREATRLEGELWQLQSAIGRAKGRIAETELKILQIDRDLSTEAAQDLRDVEAKIAEFVERQVAAEDQLKRIDIRAPQTGVVHQLSVHTIGGVIAPGEQIMLIVPAGDRLTIEAKVAPHDVDQITPGQTTRLRLTAFNQQTSPELEGVVTRVAADAVLDQRTGLASYGVRIHLPDPSSDQVGNLKLVPGMPVEVFLQTGSRSVLSYFLKPLHDQLARTFKDE